MRVLVTGGAGFIGSALCLALIEGGHEVLNLDALTYAASPASLAAIAAHPGYRFVKADISDGVAVTQAFSGFSPEAVLHLAAESHVDRSITGPGDFLDTNITGSFVMLQAALAHWRGLPRDRADRFRYLHVSTDEVYGSLGDEGLFREDTAYDPRSPYSASKAASDHLARAWFHTYGLPVIVSNCSNNYGPRQFPEKLIPLMILSAREGRPLPVYGDGGNVRDWLHVEDHVAALDLIVRQGLPGRTYNVGGRNERTNLQVVEAICAALDRLAPRSVPHRALIRFVEDRMGHDRRYAIDASRLETELGWRARWSFDAGIEATVRWYLDNEAWWGPLWARTGGRRLGLGGAAG